MINNVFLSGHPLSSGRSSVSIHVSKLVVAHSSTPLLIEAVWG